MAVHQLKCAPMYFAEVIAGRKPFEIRFNDRDFRVGDTLVLQEWASMIGSESAQGYTGREHSQVVTYILSSFEGLKDGWVAMGLGESMKS